MEKKLKYFFKDLCDRELISNYANLENFYLLKKEEKKIYWGIDCNHDTLHIGHLLLIIQIIRFAKEDFKIFLMLGESTSRIGDPSDKIEERIRIKEKDISNFSKKIKEQIEKILISPKKIENYGKNPLENFYNDSILIKKIYQILKIKENWNENKKWKEYLKYIWPFWDNKIDEKFQIISNKKWLEKISYIDFIDKIGRKLTVNYILAKDWIKKRLSKGLSYLGFSYSLLQAYDFYYLYKNYDCKGQLGGSDQWGNITTGLKLIKSYYPSNNAFAFNFCLLKDKMGKKISKSGDKKGIIFLNSDEKIFCDFFQNMSDEQVLIYIKQFTFLKKKQINELIKLNNPPKLRILQRILLELIYWINYQKLYNVRINLEQ